MENTVDRSVWLVRIDCIDIGIDGIDGLFEHAIVFLTLFSWFYSMSDLECSNLLHVINTAINHIMSIRVAEGWGWVTEVNSR